MKENSELNEQLLTIGDEQWARPRLFATIVDTAVGTLANDRITKRGFPFSRIGGRIYYPLREAAKLLRANMVVPRGEKEVDHDKR